MRLISWVVFTAGIAGCSSITVHAQPIWQTHATWCLTDNGSGGQIFRNACAQYDQFDSVLSCQQHNPGAQEAIRRAGREQVNAFMAQYAPEQCQRAYFAPPPSAPIAGPVYGAEPEWQIHARWCLTDGGAGGQNYRNACAQYDQFDSILSCQQHNPEAQAAIQRAGRRQVDAFMAQFAPEQCQQAYFAPPPEAPIAGPVYGAEPEWQIHARWCLADGGAGGQNYRNACTQFDQFDSVLSCQQHNSEAQDALRRAGRRQVNAFMAQFAPGQCR
jgi:hypothetical protein